MEYKVERSLTKGASDALYSVPSRLPTQMLSALMYPTYLPNSPYELAF